MSAIENAPGVVGHVAADGLVAVVDVDLAIAALESSDGSGLHHGVEGEPDGAGEGVEVGAEGDNRKEVVPDEPSGAQAAGGA